MKMMEQFLLFYLQKYNKGQKRAEALNLSNAVEEIICHISFILTYLQFGATLLPNHRLDKKCLLLKQTENPYSNML